MNPQPSSTPSRLDQKQEEGGEEEEKGLFSTSTNPPTSIIDCEKELMKKRYSLLTQLKNPIIYEEFMAFMSCSKSISLVFLLNLYYSICLIPLFICCFFTEGVDRRYFICFVITIVFGVIAVIAGWLLYAALVEDSCLRKKKENASGNVEVRSVSSCGGCGDWLFAMRGYSSWNLFSDELQSILFFSLAMMKGLLLINRTWVGDCPTHHLEGSMMLLYSWSCNPNADGNLFPMDSALMAMVLPLLLTCIMRETRIHIVLSIWMIVVFSLSFSTYLLHGSSYCVLIVICYVLVSGLILIDNIQQYLLFYLLSRHLKKTIETNQRLAFQNKATEMRHLIANVAHDLKTPLSSFMTGIEVIASDVQDYSDHLDSNGLNNKEYISSFLSSLKSSIHNIRDTNSFMLMTINRCLDYVKASNGLRLVPKNETIDLQEALKMPLQCMTSIQQKMKITLLPYEDQRICSHVITDKQWLQENILCLLSNAVKYSVEGEVIIKLTKLSQEEDENKPINAGGARKKLPLLKIPHFLDDEIVSDDRRDDAEEIVTTQRYADNRRSSLLGLASIRMDSPIFFIPRTPMNFNKVLPIQHNRLTPTHPQSPTYSTGTYYQRAERRSIRSNSDDSTVTPNGNNAMPRTVHSVNTGHGIAEGSNTLVDISKNLDELVFEVIDTGIGIAEEAMKSLFNPFKQTQRLAGGTGLGLYSLAKRIEALKGKYGVHKREDGKQGSVFWFTIPYKPDEVTATDALQAKENQTLKPFGGSARTTDTILIQNRSNSIHEISSSKKGELSIILAEDTPSIAKMTTLMLRRQHYQTEVAENGQILLNKLYHNKDGQEEKKYDVVLMDLQMPVMDGLEATRRIRAYEKDLFDQTGRSTHQIIIGVSANSDYETMEEGLKAGLDDFLPKPFSLTAFLELVKRIQEKFNN